MSSSAVPDSDRAYLRKQGNDAYYGQAREKA
jgi:hypothetical protein